jgi:tRNA 2-thiouridine synthesizing protein A
MEFEDPAHDPSTEQLAQRVAALRGSRCAICGRSMCGHELLFTVASGSDRTQCLPCLAASVAARSDELRDHFHAHFRQRACYGEVWRQESQREGFAADSLPGCLWPPDAVERSGVAENRMRGQDTPVAVTTRHADDTWDAGPLNCGELVLMLRRRLQALPARSVLRLTARDLGAKEDIPAWCRLTGHRLLEDRHPEYWIERRDS